MLETKKAELYLMELNAKSNHKSYLEVVDCIEKSDPESRKAVLGDLYKRKQLLLEQASEIGALWQDIAWPEVD